MTLKGYTWTMVVSLCLLFWSLSLSFLIDHAILDVLIVLSASYLGFMVCPALRKYRNET